MDGVNLFRCLMSFSPWKAQQRKLSSTPHFILFLRLLALRSCLWRIMSSTAAYRETTPHPESPSRGPWYCSFFTTSRDTLSFRCSQQSPPAHRKISLSPTLLWTLSLPSTHGCWSSHHHPLGALDPGLLPVGCQSLTIWWRLSYKLFSKQKSRQQSLQSNEGIYLQ